MIILVDMDDTIEHLLQAWVDGLNARYGRNVTIDVIRTWNVAAAYPGISERMSTRFRTSPASGRP